MQQSVRKRRPVAKRNLNRNLNANLNNPTPSERKLRVFFLISIESARIGET
jgi:hypothetical protein